jgi:hypothetical protein
MSVIPVSQDWDLIPYDFADLDSLIHARAVATQCADIVGGWTKLAILKEIAERLTERDVSPEYLQGVSDGINLECLVRVGSLSTSCQELVSSSKLASYF